jgi:hypothetical protein
VGGRDGVHLRLRQSLSSPYKRSDTRCQARRPRLTMSQGHAFLTLASWVLRVTGSRGLATPLMVHFHFRGSSAGARGLTCAAKNCSSVGSTDWHSRTDNDLSQWPGPSWVGGLMTILRFDSQA